MSFHKFSGLVSESRRLLLCVIVRVCVCVCVYVCVLVCVGSACVSRACASHLVAPLPGHWGVDGGQLDHRLPDMRVGPSGSELELDGFHQTGLVLPGEDGAIGPHAESGLAAPEGQSFVSHAVVKPHCRHRGGESSPVYYSENSEYTERDECTYTVNRTLHAPTHR